MNTTRTYRRGDIYLAKTNPRIGPRGGAMMVSTVAINADPKTALASRFAMKARADNKFSRKRPRRLGGSPAVFVRTAQQS